MIIPKAVYNYAAMVNHTLETPRQNKLDHDVSVILGSSDPPPGFGFLHPRFYYLEQKRPIPLEPLQVSISFSCYDRIAKKKINLCSSASIVIILFLCIQKNNVFLLFFTSNVFFFCTSIK